jgi:hypothetical protein
MEGSFWWKDVFKLVDQLRGIVACKIGDGRTARFWSDVWNDLLLQQRFPKLFSFAKNPNISVAQFLQNNQLECQLHLLLSEQAYLEYQELQQVISQIQVDESTKDSWHYAWGNSTYTSSKFYHYPYRSVNPPRPHSYGFGTQVVLTKLKSSPGSYSWIG